MMRCTSLLASFGVLALAVPATAGIRYVDRQLASGANNGSSWANAYQGALGLQAALTAATAGDQIWVARGSYFASATGPNTVSFMLKSGVELYGGFAGGETQLSQRDHVANPTILEGDRFGNDSIGNYTDNTNWIVRASGVDSSAVLDGFTVQHGYMGGSTFGDNSGAGLNLSSSSPRIVRCTVYWNDAERGAGAYISNGSPVFQETTFVENVSLIKGGGVFIDSTPPSQPVLFDRCSFIANYGEDGGGAFVSSGGGAARFVNCVFLGNSASQRGGALNVHGAAIVEQCSVVDNRSSHSQPGGIYAVGGSALPIRNSIVYFNSGQGGSMGPNDNVLGVPSASWSCVQGGLPGIGMLSADPQFISWTTRDLRLGSTSPCCDAGNNFDVPAGNTLDLDGNPRLADNVAVADTGSGFTPFVDMGAYEVPNQLYTAFCVGDGSLATPCPCANNGQLGHGCAHSELGSIGALLVASGTASPDTVVLHASDLLPTVTCVFLQGNAIVSAGAVFGDGVRCVGGSLKRLYIKSASSGLASAPTGAEPTIAARSAALGDTIAAGTERYYQVYYRDPDLTWCPNPPGSSWNVTSGVILQW